jgi:ABC-type multidrug transport system fused ATPase/permease subunit
VILWIVARHPVHGVVPVLAVTPLGAAAAFNLPAVGGASILVADIAALTLFALVVVSRHGAERIAGTARPYGPGFFLFLLFVFCVFAALFLPRVFAGQTDVFPISRAATEDGIVASPLRPTTGNLTQLFRVMLGVALFFAVATVLRRRPDTGLVLKAMAVATGVHVALGWADVLTFRLGLADLVMEPLRTANYAILYTHHMVGLKRMIGGFPEASSFGYYTLGLFGFWLQYWALSPRSRLAPWMLALIAVALLRSTSSAAYVAAAVFLATFCAQAMLAGIRPHVSRRAVTIGAGVAITLWLGLLALFAAYQLAEPVTAYLDRALFNKLETDSGVERMSWNVQAWTNFTETWGMGAGLGALRASNWLLACLGSLGAIGTGLFLAFLWRLAALPTGADRDRAAVIRGLKAGCLAQFLSAMLTHPTPDLGIAFFAFAGLAAGLSRGAVLESSGRPAPPPRPGPAMAPAQ